MTMRNGGATPCADKLRSFGQVRGYVFGNYAEASDDVHYILKLATDALAAKTWRRLGRRSEAEARSSW